MSDDKKNISIEVGMPTAATALEQSAPDKAEPIVTDPVPVEKTVPADKAEPAVPEYPGSATPEQPKPEKKAQQTAPLDKDAPARHIPARWWILPPPVTRRPRTRKRRSSRSCPRKRTRPPNPAEADRPRMARPLPIRQSSPNLGTKSPKVRLPRRSLPWIRAALSPVRRSRRSHLCPVMPLDR